MTLVNGQDLQAQLDRCMPVAKKVKLGKLLVNMIVQFNQLITDHNTLKTSYDQLITDHNTVVTKYSALLAHLDTGNVAGIGNANVATYGASATTAGTVAATTATALPTLGSN